ncbi:hypothetical protein Tcan_09583 [Toxocara canis]|uniref:Uncharacterized protein n=1 Tax=Toxocara canis TaxID=6265 RepID=A0A0B2VGA1_TOXCA|nr:hypothetical protein Tcan_09583 [Toxocara canis]
MHTRYAILIAVVLSLQVLSSVCHTGRSTAKRSKRQLSAGNVQGWNQARGFNWFQPPNSFSNQNTIGGFNQFNTRTSLTPAQQQFINTVSPNQQSFTQQFAQQTNNFRWTQPGRAAAQFPNGNTFTSQQQFNFVPQRQQFSQWPSTQARNSNFAIQGQIPLVNQNFARQQQPFSQWQQPTNQWRQQQQANVPQWHQQERTNAPQWQQQEQQDAPQHAPQWQQQQTNAPQWQQQQQQTDVQQWQQQQQANVPQWQQQQQANVPQWQQQQQQTTAPQWQQATNTDQWTQAADSIDQDQSDPEQVQSSDSGPVPPAPQGGFSLSSTENHERHMPSIRPDRGVALQLNRYKYKDFRALVANFVQRQRALAQS